MQVDETKCQGRVQDLRAASEALPLLMLYRRLLYFKQLVTRAVWHLKNHGIVKTWQKTVAFARVRLRGRSAETAKVSEAGWSVRCSEKIARREANSVRCDVEGSQSGTEGNASSHEEVLNLEPGEIVEVKSEEEIGKTLDTRGSHKGLLFLPEMREYCGKRFRVFKRLERMMIESTGEVRRVKNTVLLEGLVCDGSRHHGCDRSCFFFWREIWLRRLKDKG